MLFTVLGHMMSCLPPSFLMNLGLCNHCSTSGLTVDKPKEILTVIYTILVF